MYWYCEERLRFNQFWALGGKPREESIVPGNVSRTSTFFNHFSLRYWFSTHASARPYRDVSINLFTATTSWLILLTICQTILKTLVREFGIGSTGNLLTDIFLYFIICLLDNVLILWGEILSWSLMRVKGLKECSSSYSLDVSKRCFMSRKLSSSECWNFLASVTSEVVNVAITKLILEGRSKKPQLTFRRSGSKRPWKTLLPGAGKLSS